MDPEPLLRFQDHRDGHNGTVEIWPDRIEWERKTSKSKTATRWTAAALTAGMSLAATGVRGKKATETIPMRSVASVTTRRQGMRYTAVLVATAGGVIEFHVTTSTAEQVKATILANL